MIRFILVFVCSLYACFSYTQTQRTCGTDEYHAEMMKDPEFAKNFKEQRKVQQQKLRLRQNVNCGNIVHIPVAVHFFGAVTSANMTCLLDASLAQIQVMNEDFAAQNSDISNYTPLTQNCSSTYPASALSDGTCLEFCLAQYDHPSSSGLAEGDYAITIGQHEWPNAGSDWSGYMNIFVDNYNGLLGQAPVNGGANPNGNGFRITASAFGGPGISCTSGTGINTSGSYNLGRTATHEAGHYFNLDHIFAGCSNGDGIADTPNQSTENYGCPSTNTSTCTSNAENSCSTEDFWFNYMDYVNDACMWMFTADQAAVMYISADHNLWGDHLVKCQTDPNACNIQTANSIVNTCNDAGTPSDPTDDTFTFNLNPSGVNLGSTYALSGDVFGSTFPYGVDLTFDNNGQGYLISNGTLTVTITDNDDPSCTLTVFINPPSPCASPDASFVPNGDFTVCENSPNVLFSDTSLNDPNMWSWSVSGPDATIIDVNQDFFTVAFNVSGSYTVTLVASNDYGSDTYTATFNVSVLPSSDSNCQNCDYTLTLWDRIANGWNNNQNLQVTIDGLSTTYQGPPNGSLSQSITINASTGQDIQVVASNGGNNNSQSQMSWRLFDEQGYVVLGGGDSYGIGPGDSQGNNAPILNNAASGTFTTTVNCSSVSPCDNYTLTLVLDTYPDETAWQILDASGNYVYQSSGYENQASQTIIESFCLPEGCYDFLMIDFFGDGICCAEGNGSYELVRDSDGTVVASGGEFEGLESTNFCVDFTLPCNLTADNLIVSLCDDGGTPSNPMDDTYTFTLNPSGDNLGSTYSVSGDVSGSGYAYGSATAFDNGGVGYLISGGNLALIVSDDNSPSCELSITIAPPMSCSDDPECLDLVTVSDPVGPGDYVADSILTSAGVISNGMSVNFFAGDTVYLENNFEVEQGAELLVDIMDCDAYMMNSANASTLYLKPYDGLEMVALLDKNGNIINTTLGSESGEQYQQMEMDKLLETGVYFIQYKTAEGSTIVKKLFVD